jgi:hypothetical protein
MKLRSTRLAAFVLTAALAGFALEAALGADNSNITGTWKLTFSSTNTQARPSAQTLKLKLSGSTLTGTLSYNTGPIVNGKARVATLPIAEAKLQGNELSFKFTHPPTAGSGPNSTYSYQGRLSGDTLKGTFTTERMGETRTRGWEAQRLSL